MARAGLTGGARGARAGGIERGSGRRARPNQQEQQRDGEEAARFVWVCRGHLGNFENSVGVVRILKFKNLK
jgi:hypothetical protein